MEDFGHKLHQIFSLDGSDLGQFKLETQFTTYIVDKFVELINQFCFNNEHPFSFFRKFNNREFGKLVVSISPFKFAALRKFQTSSASSIAESAKCL